MNNRIVLNTLDDRVKLDAEGFECIYPRAYYKDNYFVYLDQHFNICKVVKDVELGKIYEDLKAYKRKLLED